MKNFHVQLEKYRCEETELFLWLYDSFDTLSRTEENVRDRYSIYFIRECTFIREKIRSGRRVGSKSSVESRIRNSSNSVL